MDLAFFRNIPPVTRTLLGASALLAMSVTLRIVNEQSLTFVPQRLADGELWRMVTSLLYVKPLSVEFLTVWGPYIAPSQFLEFEYYPSSHAYIWRLVLLSISTVATCAYFGVRSVSTAFLTAILYVGSHHTNDQFGIIIGFIVVAPLLPYHHIVQSVVLLDDMGAAKAYIIGIVLGHAILLADDVFPQWTRRRILALPGERANF